MAINVDAPIKQTVNIALIGNGAVTSDTTGIDCGAQCSHNFDGGSLVTLTATPGEGEKFLGWEGVIYGTKAAGNTCYDTRKTTTANIASISIDLFGGDRSELVP